MDSILDTIKKMVGGSIDYGAFDIDLITLINRSFGRLTTLGVGPEEGFSIIDSDDLWEDYMPDNLPVLEMIKTYIYLKAKVIFDPPLSSKATESMEKEAKELEWVIASEIDHPYGGDY